MSWTEGRSKGTTLTVKRPAEFGANAAGKRLKTCNAEVVDSGSSCEAPQQVTGTAATEERSLILELADSAPLGSRSPPTVDKQPALIQRLESLVDAVESLSDAVSGMEARVLRSFHAIESRLTQMQADIDELKSAHPPSASSQEESLSEVEVRLPASTPVPVLSSTMVQQTPARRSSTSAPSALTDATNRSSSVGDYCIAQEDVEYCIATCKSRRNLAARLAMRIFSLQERFGSNCRGVGGKRALNVFKTRAIFNTGLQHYPLQGLETNFSAEREMRNAVDEVCRKTRLFVK